MKTPEDNMKKVKKEEDELLARTVRIPLKKNQMDIIKEINEDRFKYQQALLAVDKREQDLITFTLALKDIDREDTASINLDGNDIVIIKKPVEKKEEPIKEILEEEKKYISEKAQERKELAEVELTEESNHK